jgi:hypothetical protein
MNATYRTTTTTLQEYRMDYPWTASIPTLTQSRMLWALLDRQSQMAAARGRRRAQRQSRAAAMRYAFAHPWRALNGEYPPELA